MVACFSQLHRYDGSCNCDEETEIRKEVIQNSEGSSGGDDESVRTCAMCQIYRVDSLPDF